MLGRPQDGQMGRTVMGEDWGPEVVGPRLLGLRGCCVATTFPSVLGLSPGGGWETRPTQPCLAGRGGTCSHLLCSSLTGPGLTTWSSALGQSGQALFLEAVCDLPVERSRALYSWAFTQSLGHHSPFHLLSSQRSPIHPTYSSIHPFTHLLCRPFIRLSAHSPTNSTCSCC